MPHARLSPSSAKRWMLCPGSVNFTAGMQSKSSKYAQEGTNAHYALEHCINTSVRPEQILGNILTEPESGVEFEVTREMVDAVNMVFNVIDSRYEGHKKAGGTVFKIHNETQLFPLRMGRYDCWGRGDITIETDTYIEPIDFKYGAGIPVEANDPQLKIYGIGALDTFGADRIPLVTTVVQPRCDHPDGHIRSVLYQPEDYEAYTVDLIAAAAATDDPNAPLVPGDVQCQFCPGKATCPAIANKALEAAQNVFKDISDTNSSELQSNLLREPESLSLDSVRMILENAPLITSWVSAVQGFAKDQMLKGIDIPGFKLIKGRRAKKWDLDEEELEKLMRSMKRTDRKKVTLDDIYERKIRTPAGMEKALKGMLTPTNWGKIKEHINVVDGAPQIAPETSSKPAIKVKAEEVFKDVSDDNLPDFMN